VTTIAVLIFDGVEELDFVGPWEVLAAWASQHPDDDVEIYTVGWTSREVECAKRLRVTADRSRDELGTPDVLLVPGGRGTRPLIKDEAFLELLRHTADRGARIVSVCTGSLTLAAAGLLDGKPATTHWSTLDALASLGEDVDVRPDERFVVTGNIITAAGVSAGIDMALQLVADLSSVERAREVRRYIQYDPEPPV
jgi:transcriptional regulator GlxA family with amidase domain